MEVCDRCYHHFTDEGKCAQCRLERGYLTGFTPLTARHNPAECETQIVAVKGNWREVLNDCRFTVGKRENVNNPSRKFRNDILIAEHSPIRDISIKWKWLDMPHWVTTHWARHRWEKFITTQRTDRTGIPREKLPQDEPQNFTGEANLQHLIDTWRKRLCYQAAPETRRYAEDFKKIISELDEDISNILVPHCVYRCGCPEIHPCGWWQKFSEWADEMTITGKWRGDIRERYLLYNHYFWTNGGVPLETGD